MWYLLCDLQWAVIARSFTSFNISTVSWYVKQKRKLPSHFSLFLESTSVHSVCILYGEILGIIWQYLLLFGALSRGESFPVAFRMKTGSYIITHMTLLFRMHVVSLGYFKDCLLGVMFTIIACVLSLFYAANDLKPPPYSEFAQNDDTDTSLSVAIPDGQDSSTITDAPPPYTPSAISPANQQVDNSQSQSEGRSS